MSWVRRIRIMDRDQAIEAIATIRRDWEGEDLLEIQAPIGLTLADVGVNLGLDKAELRQAFGNDLFDKLASRGVVKE